jgi:hypothetical protein
MLDLHQDTDNLLWQGVKNVITDKLTKSCIGKYFQSSPKQGRHLSQHCYNTDANLYCSLTLYLKQLHTMNKTYRLFYIFSTKTYQIL